MAFSGIRPQVLGNSEGKDGLRLKDLSDIEIINEDKGKQSVRANKDILLIKVRFNLSKKRFRYHTFLCPEGTRYLIEYLEDRIRSGEILNEESPILQFDQDSKKEHEVLSTHYLTKAIRETVRGSGFEWRPYVFRAYFATGMDIAESKGLVSHSWRQHWMGHIGDIESKYSTNKKLPEDILERMRESYSNASKFLETEERGIPEKQHNKDIRDMVLLMLTSAGYTQDEIERDRLLDLEIPDIAKKISEKKSMAVNNGNPQKVVSFKEVETYIEQGWEYVRDFPPNKGIVKLPS